MLVIQRWSQRAPCQQSPETAETYRDEQGYYKLASTRDSCIHHISQQRGLKRVFKTHKSRSCSHTQSIDKDGGSDQTSLGTLA